MSAWRKWFKFCFKSFWRMSFLFVFISIAVGIFLCFSILKTLFLPTEVQTPTSSAWVLALDVEGIIMNSQIFLTTLRKHIYKDNIKAVVVRVNSPGGAVGASQAIYREFISLREELKKPIIMSFEAVAASGAYYIAAGADKIVTNPGTLVGSIGVIMNLANLESLYKWAKIEPYVLKTGKYKDTGTSHRSMTLEERHYMQGLLEEVLDQFKRAIIEGRQMEAHLVSEHADGRIFTGETAVKLGFADKVGNFSDAVALAEELTGEEKLEVFDPAKRLSPFLKWFEDFDGMWSGLKNRLGFSSDPLTPMYLMPAL